MVTTTAPTAPGRTTASAVAGAQNGETAAMDYLYVRYAGDVYRYVQTIVVDPHEAEDVTQNVFVKVMGGIGSYEPGDVPFAAWLRRVARNAALDTVRRRRAVPSEGEVSAEAPSLEKGVEDMESLRRALASLPADQRHAFVLRHVGGLSPGEIAHKVSRTESAVHALLHRARRAVTADLRPEPV
jgi:RNA polymerase sigma-70 factor, ECF subfamily